MLQEGNELFVHHAVIYSCAADLPKKFQTPDGFECYAAANLDRQQYCSTILGAWAVGGEVRNLFPSPFMHMHFYG